MGLPHLDQYIQTTNVNLRAECFSLDLRLFFLPNVLKFLNIYTKTSGIQKQFYIC